MAKDARHQLNDAFLAKCQDIPPISKIPHKELRDIFVEDPVHDALEKLQKDLGIDVVVRDGEPRIINKATGNVMSLVREEDHDTVHEREEASRDHRPAGAPNGHR